MRRLPKLGYGTPTATKLIFLICSPGFVRKGGAAGFSPLAIFFLACSETFGLHKGQEWWVSHYLFKSHENLLYPLDSRSSMSLFPLGFLLRWFEPEWNQWRGPTRDGMIPIDSLWPKNISEDKLLPEMEEEHCQGYPGPVLSKDLVFTVEPRKERSGSF